jgi:hypothetical protein
MTAYNKFTVALIGAIITGLSAFGYNFAFLTPELQATLASLLTAGLVWLVPNKTP